MWQLDGLFVFLMLVLGHVIGDFFLQPDHWVKSKNTKKAASIFLYLHAGIHGVIVALIIGWATEQNFTSTMVVAIFLMLAHGIIDYLKAEFGKGYKWFFIDQLLHITTIILLWFYLYGAVFEQIKVLLARVDYSIFFLVTLAYVLMLKPSGVVVSLMLSKWTGELTPNEITTQSDDISTRALSNAGQYIGYIERILVLTFILNNQFAAVGFVLAAKSIFRMGDLREAHDRKFTEYVMLGTLFSMSLALFSGLFVAKILP